MAQRTPSAAQLQQIQELAAGWGKIIARRVFGDAGPGTDVDFQTMEQIAAAAARGLLEGTLTSLLQQQAQPLLGSQQPCPQCSRLCPVDTEQRSLVVQGGQLCLDELVCHCPDCRRDFFPPTPRPAPGQPQLQPHRVAPDCRGRR